MERRLAAILSADVTGYSRLMSDDEVATVRTVTDYRAVIAGVVARHRGRVVDATGDNALAEFASAVDAVECAVAIQRELATRNAALPGHRRMRFRIGVNLGDVIADGERIYGDGVNIAARVQALADPGGVAVAASVWDQVKNKLLDRALALARAGRALDETFPGCRSLLAEVYLWKKEHDRAVAEAKRVLALDPNSADGHAELAEILAWTGRPEEAIAHVRTAMRLNPRPPFHYAWVLGHAYYLTRDYARAVEALRRVLAQNPIWLPAHAYLAAAYAEVGRLDAAHEALRNVQRLNPGASLSRGRERLPYRDSAVLQRVLDAFARAEARAS